MALSKLSPWIHSNPGCFSWIVHISLTCLLNYICFSSVTLRLQGEENCPPGSGDSHPQVLFPVAAPVIGEKCLKIAVINTMTSLPGKNHKGCQFILGIIRNAGALPLNFWQSLQSMTSGLTLHMSWTPASCYLRAGSGNPRRHKN